MKTDDSNSITVTASVLDASNAAVEGVTVQFSTTTGALSVASAVTDSSGTATVDFHCGLVDQSNRQALITATLGELTASVPVQILGTTVTVTQQQTTLSGDPATDEIEIFVADASGNPIYNATVSVTVTGSNGGNATVSLDSTTTDVNGIVDATVTGTSSGTVDLSVSSANALGSCTYTVSVGGTETDVLQISLPEITPGVEQTTLPIGSTLLVTVTDPNNGTVVLTTSIGYFNGVTTQSYVTLNASSGSASATLATTVGGIATLNAYNTLYPSIRASKTVTMYSPASNATNITVQASSRVVGLSNATLTNSVEIQATVTDSAGNPVGNVPVAFSMANTTGGGERLSPSVVFTNDGSNADQEVGVASTTFTSGSISSDNDGVAVTAALVANPAVSDSINIIIGGSSGSVVVGVGTTATSVNNDTAYEVGVSVLVADANGTPVPGATVAINLWPKGYYIGHAWDDDIGRIGAFENEDVNRNLQLDPGEDLNGDGELTPLNSTAGNMLAVIQVDENGVGTFTWTYLKEYAGYIKAEIKASTLVLGSETTGTLNTELRALKNPDIEDGLLGATPFTPPTTFDEDYYRSLTEEQQDAYWTFPPWS